MTWLSLNPVPYAAILIPGSIQARCLQTIEQALCHSIQESGVVIESKMKPIKVGISTCLLGDSVRYDGSHKLNRFLKNTLGKYVEWVPVCPEVEAGLPIPREAMRLVGNQKEVRLLTQKTKIDHSERMLSWSGPRLDLLEKEDLCGFVFKNRSPSSAMQDAKIYSEKGVPSRKGPGMFAREYMRRFPLIPVEDDGRLNDDGIRENFIERLFVMARWKEFLAEDGSLKGLVGFHTQHKLLLMAHSPKLLREMGRMIGDAKGAPQALLFGRYFASLMEAMKLKATVKKNVNVLHHTMGYFKKKISSDAKSELLDVIESYHRELVPLVVPITLINHYTRLYDEPYLKEQVYLNPHPAELKLRNHA